MGVFVMLQFITFVLLFSGCVNIQADAAGRGGKCKKQNGGCVQECTELADGYRCSCFAGFTMSKDGRNCDDVDECAIENGGCQQICKNVIGSYHCGCFATYTLSENGHTCISSDVTLTSCNSTNLGCSHGCLVTQTSSVCTCPDGYELLGNKKTCARKCSHGNGGCQHRCISHKRLGRLCRCRKNYVLQSDRQTCRDTRKALTVALHRLLRTSRQASSCAVNNGGCDIGCDDTPAGIQCSCSLGYNRHFRSCKDIDECAENNGGCHHKCRNSHGSYRCSCNSGYRLDMNGISCIDINECDLNDTCHYKCINSMGSYECICPPGFVKYAISRCGDVDECAVNNGGCAHKCKNTIGGYNCFCDKGYALHWNQKDCIEDTTCPANSINEKSAGILHCTPRSKAVHSHICMVACTRNEKFSVSKSPDKYQYSCGSVLGSSTDSTSYQWITSRLFTNDSTLDCPGTPSAYKYKARIKLPAKHCNLGLKNSLTPIQNSLFTRKETIHATIISLLISCDPIKKKKKKKSFINIEFEVLIKAPRITKKCSAKCSEKRAVKAGRIVTRTIKKGIAKQQLHLKFHESHLSIGKRKPFDGLMSSGCPLGQEWDATTKTCASCYIGMRFDLKTESCVPCEGEFYQDKRGQLSCQQCPSGPGVVLSDLDQSGSSKFAASMCTGWCEPGSYSPTGFAPCIPCPRGTYQPERGRVGCYVCETGVTTAREGSTSFDECEVRSDCAAGSYFNTRESTCLRCPYGYYQSRPGLNYCQRCPADTSTDFNGSDDIEACKDKTCGGTIGDVQGVIESPNYPGNYPVNSRCEWNIVPPAGRKILLVVPEIHLAPQENCGDILVMRKPDSEGSVLTYESCRSYETPTALTARSRKLWIRFLSDSQDTAKGFQIPYVTYDEDYDDVIKSIVSDGRLYSANYHQEILKDKQLRQTLLEVLAYPENYFDLLKQDFRGLFSDAFRNFLKDKVMGLWRNPLDIN